MEPDARTGGDRRGADDFWIAQRLTFGAWVVGAALQVCLFVRPTPSGVHYVGDWYRYFFRALLYEGLENYLIALPFLAIWLALFHKRLKPPRLHWMHGVLMCALAASLFVTEFDHEVMRFVGTRLTPSYVRVYATTETSWPIVFDSLLLDQGGPMVPVILWIGAPLAYILWARRTMKSVKRRVTDRWPISAALLTTCLPILAPIYVRQNLGGKGPTRRVEPVLLSVANDLASSSGPLIEPSDFAQLVGEHQKTWLAEDGDPAWQFQSAKYPYVREPVGPRADQETTAPRWNVVIFQLETFRAWNMDLMRPALPLPHAPTPFLDRLGRSDHGAYWSRHSSFGPPTVNGSIAWSCSLTPHSAGLVLATFTYIDLYCLPDAVRRHGYRAEVFTGFDPDWDNETLWYRRWYDQVHYYHDAAGDDQVLTRLAAARLKELGQSSQPFLATVVCITNHSPFTSIDATQDVAGHATASERILNTMHYTDTAVQQIIETLRSEPWFEHTLFVFLGDHGYNLGEHGATPGQFNLYRESTWVPLVMYGAHPRLRAGRHEEPASLLDVAPTLADLLDIHEPTPWLGHSLVAGQQPTASIVFERDDVTFVETADYSLVVDPDTETPRVFDPKTDPLQGHDLGGQVPTEFIDSMLQRAERQRRLNDYLIRSNRIWPGPGTASHLGGARTNENIRE